MWASVADIVSLKLDRLNLKLLMFLGRSRMLGLLQQIKTESEPEEVGKIQLLYQEETHLI